MISKTWSLLSLPLHRLLTSSPSGELTEERQTDHTPSTPDLCAYPLSRRRSLSRCPVHSILTSSLGQDASFPRRVFL